MPITQDRMLALLSEHHTLRMWASRLLEDLRALLNASELTDSMKVMALGDLLDDEGQLPRSTHYERERDHFARTRSRNERSAQRMRLARHNVVSNKGAPNGLD
jgi:hypothetical protein